MKVFSSYNSRPNPRATTEQRSTHSKNKGRRGGIRHFTQRRGTDLSDDEIRRKVAERNGGKVSISKEAKAKTQEVVDDVVDEGSKVAVGEVGINDPNDTNTQEKLKTVLKNGGFNFSEKERSVLQQILQE